MALIIDGVFLQMDHAESTRFWRTLLPRLAQDLDMPVVLLDRGGQGEQFPGIEVVPYPTYKPKFNAQDSALLERVCRHYGAEAFMSTHFTTPLQTPSALVVRDMLPERAGIELATREQQEKEAAIAHARRFVCLSRGTRDDLLEFYPELDANSIRVAECQVDQDKFKPASDSQQPERLRWATMVDAIAHVVREIAAENRLGIYKSFYDTWARLRAIQGDVDVVP